MTIRPLTPRPPAWGPLAKALVERQAVRVYYRGLERTVCPHVLGWKNRRAIVLVYQTAGATSHGPLPHNPTQRWRSFFVEDIEAVALSDLPWETAENYSLDCTGIDQPELAVELN
jgi:hypothetical protein